MIQKFLSCMLAIVLTLTTMNDLTASAAVPSPASGKIVYSPEAPVLLAAGGRPPRTIRPTFNRVAKPTAVKPKAGRPASVSRPGGRPVAAKRVTAARLRGVSLPGFNQRVSVSQAAGRKFTQALKPVAKAIVGRPLTQGGKLKAQDFLRSTVKKARANPFLAKSIRSHLTVSSGNIAIGKLPAKDRTAFSGDVIEIKLMSPMVVYRRSGGISAEKSNWFSLKNYGSPNTAKRFLALPNGNTASNRNTFIIPSGTTIFIGKSASQAHEKWAGEYAVGGGLQIYAPKIGKIRKI